jgi:hypothetical protein
LLFQTQNGEYKEYSDAYQWGMMYRDIGVFEIVINILDRALTAASTACDGAGKHIVAHVCLRKQDAAWLCSSHQEAALQSS